MDMEYRTRLILWLSHHLSNFQYFWPWDDWAFVKDLPKWAPQRVFVQEVLEGENRLSFWDKIKQSIENAPELEELLPPKGGPCFKFSIEDDGENTQGHALSIELNTLVRGKKTVREIISWIEENVISVKGHEVVVEVVIQTVLYIGSKSFTHLMTVLERYGHIISKLFPDQDTQVMLIEICSYWKNNTQNAAITIDSMMGYRLISNFAIIIWVFLPFNISQFHLSGHPWEILRNAINKTYNRNSDLRKEIQSLEKNVALAEEGVRRTNSEYEAAEAKLEAMDGEPVQAERPGRMKRLKAYADRAKGDAISVLESLEAKEVLLARALEENKALFISLYKNFGNVLMERLPTVSSDGKLRNLRPSRVDSMAIDLEEPPTMEVDGQTVNRANERVTNAYNTGEQVQWCLSTLGYVKAFSRQYAAEVSLLVTAHGARQTFAVSSKFLLGLLFLIIILMTHEVTAAADLKFYRDARREGGDIWLTNHDRGSRGCAYVDRRSLKKGTNVSLVVGFKRQDHTHPLLLGRRLSVELKPAQKFSQSMTPVSFVFSDTDAILLTDRKNLDVSLPRDFGDSWTHKIYFEFWELTNTVAVWLDRTKDPVLTYDRLSLKKVFGDSFSVGVCSENLAGGPVVQLQVLKVKLVSPASPSPPPPPPPVRIRAPPRRLFSPPPPPSPQEKQPIEPPPPPHVVSPPLPSPPEEPRGQLSPAKAPKTETARKRKLIIMLVLGFLMLALVVTVILYAFLSEKRCVKSCRSTLHNWLFVKYPMSPRPVANIDVFPRGFQQTTLTRRRGRGCKFF